MFDTLLLLRQFAAIARTSAGGIGGRLVGRAVKGGFGPDSYYVKVQPRPIVKIKARTRWKGVMGKDEGM